MGGKGLTDEQNERLRARIRAVAAEQNLTQVDLAKILEMKQPSVSSFLGGRQGTSWPTARKFARFIHEDTEAMLSGDASSKRTTELDPADPVDRAAVIRFLAREKGVDSDAIDRWFRSAAKGGLASVDPVDAVAEMKALARMHADAGLTDLAPARRREDALKAESDAELDELEQPPPKPKRRG